MRETLQLGPTVNGAPEMRYYDGAANDKTDRQRLEQLGARHALLGAEAAPFVSGGLALEVALLDGAAFGRCCARLRALKISIP